MCVCVCWGGKGGLTGGHSPVLSKISVSLYGLKKDKRPLALNGPRASQLASLRSFEVCDRGNARNTPINSITVVVVVVVVQSVVAAAAAVFVCMRLR